MKNTYDALKMMVNERTLELMNKNALLEAEIKERKQIQELLDERLRFETILSNLSAKIINVPPEGLEEEIDSSLRLLAQYLEADEGSLILFDEDRPQEPVIHSYAVRENPLATTILQYPSLGQKIQRGEVMALSKIPAALSNNDLEERKYFLERGYQAVLVVPLRVGGRN